MADVDSGGGGGGRQKKGGPKTKKKSTKIDMTAMVDVAFLLLTFFVLTATMTDANVMELTMPPKVDEAEKDDLYIKIDEKKIMTLMLYEDDEVKYYQGITDIEVKTTNFSGEGLRKAILSHLNYGPRVLGIKLCEGKGETKGCWDPIFLIKPKGEARYKNLIDLLDELAIVNATKFAIDKYTSDDSLRVAIALEAKELEGQENE